MCFEIVRSVDIFFYIATRSVERCILCTIFTLFVNGYWCGKREESNGLLFAGEFTTYSRLAMTQRLSSKNIDVDEISKKTKRCVCRTGQR